jgi:ABC-type nitrate/sulfonate/bicarbonate transport system substrate-binding protein
MGTTAVRIGFVPLIDAAPVIVAHARGFFDREQVPVSLHRQLGWANVRDKLSFGHLDASHALLGMPLTSYLGRDAHTEPLTALMALGAGGNAITVRKELFAMGVQSAADLALLLKNTPHLRRLIVGHVFPASMHHYLLRDWLASADIHPDTDVKLCVIPPPQIADHMKGGYVDLFCVGEPWNTLARRSGFGVPIVATTDILPDHPEKILAVTGRFAQQHPQLLVPLIRALLQACAWCEDEANREELAALLARPEYLAQPADVLRESLDAGRDFGAGKQHRTRAVTWALRTFAPAAAFPAKTHAAWMLTQMVRWGHLHPEADIHAIADACCNTAPFRAAAASLDLPCPADDFPPMPLRNNRVFTADALHPAAPAA